MLKFLKPVSDAKIQGTEFRLHFCEHREEQTIPDQVKSLWSRGTNAESLARVSWLSFEVLKSSSKNVLTLLMAICVVYI